MNPLNAVASVPQNSAPLEAAPASVEAAEVDPAARSALKGVMTRQSAAPAPSAEAPVITNVEVSDEDGPAPRPLSGAAADAADRAHAVLASESGPAEKLAALDDIRREVLEAGAPGTDVACAHLDDLARSVLTAPLDDAAAKLAETHGTPVTMAQDLFERCVSAQTADELEQASWQLEGFGKTLEGCGLLGDAAAEALDALGTMLVNKRGIEALLTMAKADADAAAKPDAPGLREAFGLCAEVERQSSPDAADRPPFAHLLTSGLAHAARDLEARLADISAERLAGALEAIGTIEAEALGAEPDFEKLAGDLSVLEGRMPALEGTMLARDEARLADGLEGAKHGLILARHALEAQAKLDSRSAFALEGLRDELASLDVTLVCDDIRAHFDDVVNRLDVRIHDLHSEARSAERQFCDTLASRFEAGIEEDRGRGLEAEGLHEAAAQRMAALMVPGPESNLTEADRAEAVSNLAALDQAAYVQAFDALLDFSSTPRLDAPTLADVSQRLDEMPIADDAKAEARMRLEAKSSESLAELRGMVRTAEEALATLDFDALRDAPLLEWRTLADNRLTEADRTALEADLKAFGEKLEGALLEKTLASFEGPLEADARSGVQAFMRATGYHPVALEALRDPAFADRLGLLAGLAGEGPLTPELVQCLDDLMVAHPQLDSGILAARLGHASEAEERLVLAHHESIALRRDVMSMMKAVYTKGTLARLGVEGDVASPELLERLIERRGADRALQKTDLSLVRALYAARSEEGMTFGTFAERLPEDIRSLPNLEALIGTGLEGTRQMRAVGRDLRAISKGFGGKRELADVCARLATSDDRVAVDKYLTTVMRNLHGANSITGMQALEGSASGTRAAYAQKKYAYDFGTDLVDAMRRLVGRADDTVLASREDQMKAVAAMSPAVMAEITALEGARARYAQAEAAVKRSALRGEMLDILEGCRPGSRKVEALRSGEQAKVKGAQAALSVLILDEVLTNEALTIEERRDLARGLQFQRKFDVGRMKGGAIVSRVKDNGNDFRGKLEALRSAPSPEAAETAKEALKTFMDEQGLCDKALAVLYFKDGHSASKVENFTDKFDACLSGDPAQFQIVRRHLEARLVDRVFVSASDDKTMAIAREGQIESLEAIGEEVRDCRRKLSVRLQATLDEIVNVAVAGAFLESGAYASAADLIAEREAYQDRGEWPFQKAVLAQAEKLGFPPGLTAPFVRGALDALTPDTFRELSESVSRDPFLAIRDLLRATKTPKAMKQLMAEGEFTRLAGDMLEVLHDRAKTMTLSTERSASVNIPVLETGAAEASVHIGAALRNGLSLWQGEDNRFHMTLMLTPEVKAGVSVSLLETISAQAGVEFTAGTGCDLEFADEEKCRVFLGRMLAGVCGGEDLGLCTVVKRVTEAGIGASIEVGLEGDIPSIFESDDPQPVATAGAEESGEEDEDEESWLSYELSASASGSVAWSTERNADGIVRTRTLTGHLGASAGFTAAPEGVTEKIRSAADKLENLGTDLGTKAADAVERFNTWEAEASYDFMETRSVATKHDGTLLGAEVVRTFRPEEPAAIDGLLAKFGISEACRRAVAQDAEKFGEGFRIEIVNRLPQAEVDRIAQTREGVPLAKCRPAEVRLAGIAAQAQHVKGIETELLTLAKTDAGKLEKTLRYRA